jgi:hypothetical protein
MLPPILCLSSLAEEELVWPVYTLVTIHIDDSSERLTEMSNREEKHSSDTDQAHGPQENLEHTSRWMKRCPRTMRTKSHVVRLKSREKTRMNTR